MKFRVHLQMPKPQKKPLIGHVCWNDKQVILFEDATLSLSQVLAEMDNPVTTYMSSRFIIIEGFEKYGIEKNGRPKYRYQKWNCFFDE